METQTIQHRREGMCRRLEKASHAGDVDELHRLLQEDSLLLHRPNNSLLPADNPLHIAAALGHANFVKEILARKPPVYALGFNTLGLTALHLACANGHVEVVREILQSDVGAEICVVRDRDGLLPVHTAALRGNVLVLEEMLGACSDDVVRGLTCLGDTILHLAVKSNCFEAVRFLVDRMESDHEFLSLQDAKGSTMLHLATARKQFQTVKFLLGKAWTDVNAVNKKGCTVLDVLLESPSEHGDLLLGEMIRAAGGITTETMPLIETHQPTELVVVSNNPTTSLCVNWKVLKRLCFKCFPSFSRKGPDEFKETRNTLMVVATLIATVTFQGGLNPPGGFTQYDDKGKMLDSNKGKMLDSNKTHVSRYEALMPGQALLANKLNVFLLFDIIALLSSLSVILLMICGCPQWKYMINVSMAITWIAVFSTGVAFFCAIWLIFPTIDFGEEFGILIITWYFIMTIFVSYKVIRLHIFMHRNISRCFMNMRKRRDGRTSCFLLCAAHPFLLLLIRICMVVSCLVICLISFLLLSFVHSYIIFKEQE